ncbi:glycoside hydrolase superfamily [Kockovaella imperatae]|uniref:glucan 1,3-beta-glucosidase n=1 Tax=Kockovaella imperatae TaxID=4999 RepID=A0A1Y1ULN6_9TREE|nr:glycoside hydrolase superfamily [Kockovaella imperatae]ORX38968.1 glycoside hydrolase superfamily [Kockovaella imperatae]
MDDGTTFIYTNPFNGSWAVDPANPYNVSGQAQSWTPKLTEEWVWGQDTIKGVNIGGWLVTEPFIVPNLYEQFQNSTPKAVDEYTLSEAMGDQLATLMEEHYSTFITEEDFAQIAAAGLNWLRIPIGFWAISTQEGEPFLEGVAWTYFLKAIEWARKYGLRILLDFHALPGSQNGWNHSGKEGVVNWMYGVMGLANAQRSLEYMRTFTEFISQPGIREVVPMFGLVNEVQASVIGAANLQAFYYQAYEMIRGITGYGEGNGPIIAIHEGFMGVIPWAGFLDGADRLALDQHPYLAFWGNQNHGTWQQNVTCGWQFATNYSQINFGITIGGEWSLAPNDCGYWLDGVDVTPQYELQKVGSCEVWNDWENWNQSMKDGMYSYCQAQMDVLDNWFFWTWKINNSTVVGTATSPQWHYKLGYDQGWIPKDPRSADGFCQRPEASYTAQSSTIFDETYRPSQTGGVATPTLNPAQVSSHDAWPPTSFGPSFTAAQVAFFPTYTQTGVPVTLAMPTPTGTIKPTASPTLDGWSDPTDTVGAWVSVSGCPYPPEYNATALSNLPTALCT